MRIVLTNKAVNIAGGENYVLYLASGLRKKNHEVLIAPLKDSELAAKSRELGYETIEMEYSAKGLDEIPLIFDFAKKLKDKKIDIIHTNSNTDRTVGAFASRILGCKNVAQIHSHFSIKQRSHHAFRNKFIDHFITDSFSSRNQLVYSDKIEENRVTTIHIGIPTDSALTQDSREKIRNEFNLDEKHILLGSIGRLVPFKGHIYLLKAFKSISEKMGNARLMIVGDGEIENELRASANELGIYDKVIFPGYRTDVDELLSSFDIYVHPSIDHGGESFPIAVLLALRAGLPIVATKVSDIPYQVKDNFNGFIVDAGSEVDLAEKILTLLDNNEIKNSFAKNSSEHFQFNFTLDKMVDRIENLYENVLKPEKKIVTNNSPSLVSYIKDYFTKQREVF